MRSNEAFSHVQSASASSMMKVTFGGTQLGWMGERSVPIMSAAGKRLFASQREEGRGGVGEELSNIDSPYAGASADVEDAPRVRADRSEDEAREEEGVDVVDYIEAGALVVVRRERGAEVPFLLFLWRVSVGRRAGSGEGVLRRSGRDIGCGLSCRPDRGGGRLAHPSLYAW